MTTDHDNRAARRRETARQAAELLARWAATDPVHDQFQEDMPCRYCDSTIWGRHLPGCLWADTRAWLARRRPNNPSTPAPPG